MCRYIRIVLLVFVEIVVATTISTAATVYISSSSDWASVTADDDVIIKQYQSNTVLPGDITCKSLTFNAQEILLNCDGHSITVAGDLTINNIYKCATITNGNTISVGGDLLIHGQNSSISATTVSVTGDVSLDGYETKITANVSCNDLTMSNQNTKITGSVTTTGNILISGYSAGVTGNIDCDGNLTMTSQNSYVGGNVSVDGDLTLSGDSANISGSASVGGSANISGNASVTGGVSEQVSTIEVTLIGDECSGNFSVTASEADVTYQWYKDGAAITGATSSTYDPSGVAGDYYCVCTKSTVSGTSSSITYYGGPKITSVSSNNISIINNVDGNLKSKTLTVTTVCDDDYTAVSYSLAKGDDSKFSVSKNENTFTITYNENSTETTDDDELSLICGSQTEVISLHGVSTEYPKCYDIDRYISGIYYDTYSLCTDEDGNIDIDLSTCIGDGTDIAYIPYDATWASEHGDTISYSSQQKEDANSSSFYTYITLDPQEDIVCENFTFVGTVKGGQSFDIQFINDVTIDCDVFDLNTTQAKNYFITSCDSKILASTSASLIHAYKPIEVKGYIISPTVYMSDGNNTSIVIDDCAYVKATDLTLVQSSQNNVLIEGHIVAENINAGANMQLIYNGTEDNDAIVTIGALSSDVIVICAENTTVNLCMNPNLGSADKIGYFNGTVIYNMNAEYGWPTDNPSDEGDINYNDNSSTYWTYYNNVDDIMGSSAWSNLELIAGYASYSDCIDEKLIPSLLGMEDDPFLPDDKEIQLLNPRENYCSDEYRSNRIQIREAGNRWFRYIGGELIYCENDNE